jgi:23S rRNA (guanosine2251-2'-O)-methyltransferase
VKAEVLYGFHPINEALKAKRRNIFEIYTVRDKPAKRYKRIKLSADRENVLLKEVSSATLQTIVGVPDHQGIAARVTPYPLAEVTHILESANSANRPPFLLLLDNLVDPHNLGAIIRTAVCVGLDGIIIPKNRSASPTPAVSKISAGALEHIRMAQVNNIVRSVKDLQHQGFWVVGMDQFATQSLFSADLSGALAVVIGGEQKGIRPLVKKNCDFLISIPQIGPIGSLNASVAGAIVMYESYRQRMAF